MGENRQHVGLGYNVGRLISCSWAPVCPSEPPSCDPTHIGNGNTPGADSGAFELRPGWGYCFPAFPHLVPLDFFNDSTTLTALQNARGCNNSEGLVYSYRPNSKKRVMISGGYKHGFWGAEKRQGYQEVMKGRFSGKARRQRAAVRPKTAGYNTYM